MIERVAGFSLLRITSWLDGYQPLVPDWPVVLPSAPTIDSSALANLAAAVFT